MAVATQDALMWHVEYHDRRTIVEFDNDRLDGRAFSEVNQAGIKTIGLSGRYVMALPEGASPVCLRRRSIEIDQSTGTQKQGVAHCIGWRHGEQGCYLFVFEDGSVLMTDDFQAV